MFLLFLLVVVVNKSGDDLMAEWVLVGSDFLFETGLLLLSSILLLLGSSSVPLPEGLEPRSRLFVEIAEAKEPLCCGFSALRGLLESS